MLTHSTLLLANTSVPMERLPQPVTNGLNPIQWKYLVTLASFLNNANNLPYQPQAQASKPISNINNTQHTYSSTVNRFTQPNHQQLHSINPLTQPKSIRPRPLTSIFTNHDGFKEYINLFKLKKELELHFPNSNFRTAYINRDKELVIKASTQNDHSTIRNYKWQSNAFKSGITLKEKETNFYLAILNIDTTFDVNDTEIIQEMKNQYKITQMKRMENRKLETKTRTVQVCTTDYDKYLELAKEGKIKIGFNVYKIKPWNFRATTNQCFKCCGFNHSQHRCTSSIQKCLRCSGQHSYKECKVVDTSHFKCANCSGNHSAVSKDCPKLEEHMNQMNAQQKPKTDYTRIFSTAPSNEQQNSLHRNYQNQSSQPPNQTTLSTTNIAQDSSCGDNQSNLGTLLLFITEIFTNMNELISNIEDQGGQEYLEVVNKYFGSIQRNNVENYLLSKTDDTNELF